MTQQFFKDLFELRNRFEFWRYVYYHQHDKDMFYHGKGYDYYMQNNSYPTNYSNYSNPYKKGSEAYEDFEEGFNQAFSEDEICYSKKFL